MRVRKALAAIVITCMFTFAAQAGVFYVITDLYADGSERQYAVYPREDGTACRGPMSYWPDGIHDARNAPPPALERCDIPKRRSAPVAQKPDGRTKR